MQSRHNEFVIDFNSATLRITSNFDSGNLEGKVGVMACFGPYASPIFIETVLENIFPLQYPEQLRDGDTGDDKKNENPRVLCQCSEIIKQDQQFEEYYRICIGRKQKRGWESIVAYEKCWLESMKRTQADGEYQLHFSIKVEQQIYLAYHYPYPLDQSRRFLEDLRERISTVNQEIENKIYFANQLLIESLEGRPVNLLTISSSTNMLDEEENRITKSIFPYFQMEKRPRKFNKPYVLFTCRVHSGETSASYAMEGIIQFLLSKNKRAELLRESFVFLIIPVLNPDGVYHGTYRMDTLGHNLNRFYNSAQSHKQPAIFAVQALANYYSGRIVFFMDLHSHPHPNKGSFIYGNCLNEIEEQTQTQLYAKILSHESECFGYGWCNFSTNQMNSRDINELLTKDGSARVQLYKLLNIPFAYTMQMGYHGSCIKKRQQEEVSIKDYYRMQKVFTIEDYKSHGKSILLSLLTLFQINSQNGVKSEGGKYYQGVREEVFKDLIQKQERFRLLDSFVFRKLKNIHELIYNMVYQSTFKKYTFLDLILVKKPTLLEKRNTIQTISEGGSTIKKGRSFKKQLSLNISKTIDTNSTTRQKGLCSFKSAIEGREKFDTSRFELFQSRQDHYSFAKMLNLDFNPFPGCQKRRIYNIVGNRRGSIKKTIINDLQAKQKTRVEGYDIDTEVNNQIQAAEKSYNESIKYEVVPTNRNKVMSNFNQNVYIQNQEEGTEYNDVNWQNGDRNQESKFVLPRIGPPLEKTSQNFNMQVLIQKQYEKKYNIKQFKDLTPHHKGSMRGHQKRMKSLVKSNK